MNVIATSTAAYVYSSTVNDTLVVAPNVTVAGIRAFANGVQLINYGTASNDTVSGVVIDTDKTATFINKPQGVVATTVSDPTYSAVVVNGHGTVNNQGTILSVTHGIVLDSVANNVTIVNSGDLYAGLNGIWLKPSSAASVSIVNTGEIWGDANGIHMQNAVGAAPLIFNSGIITGRFNAIVASDGERLNVTNNGTLQGHVVSVTTNGADSVTNNGKIIGDVKLGSGSDLYKGVGTVSGTVYGEAGVDTLIGGNSTDRLNGGADGDKLTGGLGIDYETGGLGNDTFVLNAPLNIANRDVITDFHNVSGDNDTFQLENAIFTKIGAGVGASHVLNPAYFFSGAAAHDTNDYIVYNPATGYLSYDSNGNASGGATLLAVLVNKPALTYADFVVI